MSKSKKVKSTKGPRATTKASTTDFYFVAGALDGWIGASNLLQNQATQLFQAGEDERAVALRDAASRLRAQGIVQCNNMHGLLTDPERSQSDAASSLIANMDKIVDEDVPNLAELASKFTQK